MTATEEDVLDERASAGDAAIATADARPDVFLSYSRRDKEVVLRVASALEDAGWNVWIDADDIPPASEWRDELAAGIRAAHTFVFVLSPDSAASDYCRWELEQAVALGKRLIPLVIRDVAEAPPELASRQYIFMRDADDSNAALRTLDTAVRTDLTWVRQHSQWLLAALRWDAQGRDRSLLVRGRELKAAEAWLARQADRLEPRPTQLQTEFLIASREWETRRTQIVAVAVAVALAVSIALGVLALLQRNEARDQAAISQSRELALAATSQLPVDPERSLLLAAEAVDARATPEADDALREALVASRMRASVPLGVRRIGGLINAVAFSEDGTRVAAALKNGTVFVSSTSARQPRAVQLPLPSTSADDLCSVFVSAGGHVAVAFSPAGSRIAAVNDRGWVHVWRWPNPAAPLTSPFCLGRATRPDPADVVSATLGTEGGLPSTVVFLDDDTLALTGRAGQVLEWPFAGDARTVVPGRAGATVAAALTARGAAFADDDHVTAVDLRARRSWRLPLRGTFTVAMSADGSTVAAATGGRISVWRPRLGKKPLVVTTDAGVRAVALSRIGDLLAVGGGDNTIHVWDLTRGGAPVDLVGTNGAVTAVAFSRDGHRIVSGGDDGALRVWEWDASLPLTLPGMTPAPARFALTREGRVIGVDGRTLRLPLAGGLRLENVLQPGAVSVSRDGRRAVAPVAPVESDSVQQWQLDEGPLPRTTPMEGRVNDVVLSPDGKWLAVAGRAFSLVAWDGSPSHALAPRRLAVEYARAAFSPDGRRVAAAAYDGKSTTISAWDFDGVTPPALARTVGALGFSTTLAFSRDGDRLVVAQSDGAVRIWTIDGTAPPIVLRGHHDAVNAAALSPDGAEVVSGGADGTIRVWPLDEGAQSVALPGPRHIVDVAFTDDGSAVIAVGTNEARMWSCDFCGSTDHVLDAARRIATRNLTAGERRLFLHER